MHVATVMVLALLATTDPGATAEHENGSADDCEAYSQAAMRGCLESKAKLSESRLKEAEQLARSSISKWDEEPKHVSLAMERFNAWTRAFEELRKRQCSFEAALGGGAIGSALELRRLRCVVELNQLQSSKLVERAKSFD